MMSLLSRAIMLLQRLTDILMIGKCLSEMFGGNGKAPCLLVFMALIVTTLEILLVKSYILKHLLALGRLARLRVSIRRLPIRLIRVMLVSLNLGRGVSLVVVMIAGVGLLFWSTSIFLMLLTIKLSMVVTDSRGVTCDYWAWCKGIMAVLCRTLLAIVCYIRGGGGMRALV